ncbi:hypothetical protein H5410_025055 [Solanum commersonii]|uniref:Uncharacterized protein n=1 Tax=Solanum commersonii TaxID=4109 RepID=A0A9J5YS22_SOLCO|nr:hypothetical protein H5410_025055 [Solanum commersonii]
MLTSCLAGNDYGYKKLCALNEVIEFCPWKLVWKTKLRRKCLLTDDNQGTATCPRHPKYTKKSECKKNGNFKETTSLPSNTATLMPELEKVKEKQTQTYN